MLTPALRRLYIARDRDAAGEKAATALRARACSAGIEALVWTPRYGDFNEDLRALGPDTLQADVRAQLVPQDAARFVYRVTAETK